MTGRRVDGPTDRHGGLLCTCVLCRQLVQATLKKLFGKTACCRSATATSKSYRNHVSNVSNDSRLRQGVGQLATPLTVRLLFPMSRAVPHYVTRQFKENCGTATLFFSFGVSINLTLKKTTHKDLDVTSWSDPKDPFEGQRGERRSRSSPSRSVQVTSGHPESIRVTPGHVWVVWHHPRIHVLVAEE